MEQQTSVALPSCTLAHPPPTLTVWQSSSVLGLRLLGKLLGVSFNLCPKRILRIHLKCHLSYMSVLSNCIPTNPPNSTSEYAGPSNAFYDQLQSTLSSVPASDLLVIMGDLNARVGSDCSSQNSVMGPHGIGKCNENGERLLDFCASNHMIVSNTWFQHKLLHQATWFQNSDRS